MVRGPACCPRPTGWLCERSACQDEQGCRQAQVQSHGSSFLAGGISLDFGGKQGSGTASGLIDGIGYLGGVISGDSMARISVDHGWSGVFLLLAAVAALSSIVAGILLLRVVSSGICWAPNKIRLCTGSTGGMRTPAARGWPAISARK
jgi:hypothetical protein